MVQLGCGRVPTLLAPNIPRVPPLAPWVPPLAAWVPPLVPWGPPLAAWVPPLGRGDVRLGFHAVPVEAGGSDTGSEAHTLSLIPVYP